MSILEQVQKEEITSLRARLSDCRQQLAMLAEEMRIAKKPANTVKEYVAALTTEEEVD